MIDPVLLLAALPKSMWGRRSSSASADAQAGASDTIELQEARCTGMYQKALRAQVCRRLGVSYWPCRKVRGLRAQIEKLGAARAADHATRTMPSASYRDSNHACVVVSYM